MYVWLSVHVHSNIVNRYVLNFYTSNKLKILYPVIIIQRVVECFHFDISPFLDGYIISNVHEIWFFFKKKHVYICVKYTCWS